MTNQQDREMTSEGGTSSTTRTRQSRRGPASEPDVEVPTPLPPDAGAVKR
jgi:hypothetical protein